ncbi:head maturation protease, ClpP-related [Micromonospora maritima]|uniref:head maturation protease, ClpP-related n=1 Tax=Micromonospora maritima TaxID=986711 RepID=UPI00157DA5CD|nr:head maturation protease, ClpP-related [Micromonospora maritima]
MSKQMLPELPARLERMRARPAAKTGDWFRIEAKADSRAAEVAIYDDIGWEGTTARQFAHDVRALDVDEITLRLNSKGGDAWDGVAIYNALKDHPAQVTVVVDGVAASAASVIAQAGDRIVMNRGSQMMIHDASGLALGDAADMREMADVLDKVSDSLAGIYAARAGGTVAQWRATMRGTQWYTAEEAVDAGLADELAGAARPKVTAAEAARRIHAAAQKTPTASLVVVPDEERSRPVDPAKIREALGLSADASDSDVRVALESAGVVAKTNPPTEPAPQPEPDPEPAPAPDPEPKAEGKVLVSQNVLEELRIAAQAGQEARAQQLREQRDNTIRAAVAEGKISPARREHWVQAWDKDPEGTKADLDSLPANRVPVNALGYDADAPKSVDPADSPDYWFAGASARVEG